MVEQNQYHGQRNYYNEPECREGEKVKVAKEDAERCSESSTSFPERKAY